jgi:hypothetical protein
MQMTQNRIDQETETDAHYALKSAGAITPCRVHPYIFIRPHNAEAERAAYAIRTAMMKRSGDMRWRQELLDEVADTLDRTEDECFT